MSPEAGAAPEPTRGRVGRRRLLTREQVARAAFALLDAHGPDALTMNRLAGELGVRPMTLYGYAASKDEIIAMLPDLLLADLPRVDPDAPWADALERLYCAIYGRFVEHRHVMQTIADHALFGRAHAEVIEGVLEVLARNGFAPDRAFAVQRTLNTYTLGHAVFAISEWQADGSRQRSSWPRTLDPATFPRIAEVAGLLRAPVTEAEFVAGLRRIMRGYAEP